MAGELIAGEIMGPEMLAIIGAFFLFFLVLGIAMYIYMPLAFSKIARKTGKSSGIAWIPLIGPMIIASQIARMGWWPILLLIFAPIPGIGFVAGLVLMVFWTIWLWKVFEATKWPGWFALLSLITPVNLVLIGLAAWVKKK